MCHRKQDILSLSCWAPPGQKSGLPTAGSSSSRVIPKPDLVHMGSLPSIPTRSDPPAQRRCKRAEVKQKILWNCVEKHLQVLILDLAWPGIHRSSGSSFQCGSLALATTPYTLLAVQQEQNGKSVFQIQVFQIQVSQIQVFVMFSESPEEGNGLRPPKAFGVRCGSKDVCADVTPLALRLRLPLKPG